MPVSTCRTGAWIPSAPGALGALGGMKGGPVGRVDEAGARNDDEQHDEDLDRDEHEVDPQGLLDALGDEKGQHGHEHERPEVEVGAGSHGSGHLDPEPAQQDLHVGGPPLGDDARAQHELEDQVPPDDPGDELTERRVREGVGGSRHRDGRGELRVAHGGEGAHDGREDEGQDDGGPGILLRGPAGDGEDARADHDADAEYNEVEGGQPALQVMVRLVGRGHGRFDRLGAEQAHGDLRTLMCRDGHFKLDPPGARRDA